MKIEVLGTGCSKCTTLFEQVKKVVASKGLFVQIEKVEDLTQIMNYRVMSTPALVIDGEVKSMGKTLSEADIEQLIEESK